MSRNPSDRDVDWIETEEVRGSTPPWRAGERPARGQRQPMNWPTAAFGIAVLAFLAVFIYLLFDLIRDLAG